RAVPRVLADLRVLPLLLALRAVPPELLDPVERVAEERLDPLPEDFARVPAELVLPEVVARDPVLREPVLREPVERELFARGLAELERPVLERDAPELLRDDVPLLDPELPLSLSLDTPESTRCAASATASAISVPSRDALDTTVLAACCAVSAASRPASRILRRAVGLRLIAAAAAASPAASISRLIAALASLSTVLSLRLGEERFVEDVDLEDPLRVLDFAIANLLFGPPQKTLQKRKGSVSAANGAAQSGDFAS
ncbi:MAG: hypothetical protein H0U34_06705, partial [Sphingomonas sp.]|nr:hypothetical protein [Sphingomonas sp.]